MNAPTRHPILTQDSAMPVIAKGFCGRDVGSHNFHIVKDWFLSHPCATNREAVKALGLSKNAVGRHVNRIRAEWGAQ